MLDPAFGAARAQQSERLGAVPFLLLDLDNTLVDRERTFMEWADTFVRLNDLSPSEVQWLVQIDDAGMAPRETFWQRVKERLDLAEPLTQLVAQWGVEFPALYRCDETTATALREARAAGWALAIVTNGDAAIQARKIAAAGLDDLVDAVCVSGAEGLRKPDPRLFIRAAERTGDRSGQGWMVGDDPESDIGGGRAAGLRTVWVRRQRAWLEPGYTPTCKPTRPPRQSGWC